MHLGLKTDSKPDLLVVLAMMDDSEAVIICNGYHDAEYIDTALMAQKLGRQTTIVIEQYWEMTMSIGLARAHGVMPILGVRATLATKGAGRWAWERFSLAPTRSSWATCFKESAGRAQMPLHRAQ